MHATYICAAAISLRFATICNHHSYESVSCYGKIPMFSGIHPSSPFLSQWQGRVSPVKRSTNICRNALALAAPVTQVLRVHQQCHTLKLLVDFQGITCVATQGGRHQSCSLNWLLILCQHLNTYIFTSADTSAFSKK